MTFLQPTSLALGTLFIPDINTTATPVLFSAQGEIPSITSPQFGQYGAIPTDFVFHAPPKRGRPKGSKTKKNVGKNYSSNLESTMGKGNTTKSKKRDCSMISIDPVELAESSGTGKKSKGEDGEEEVLPMFKEALKNE